MPRGSFSSPSFEKGPLKEARKFNPENELKGFEIETKLDLTNVETLLGETCRRLCPTGYEIEKLTPLDASSHDFYGFVDENGRTYHAFTVMHHSHGVTVKVKKGSEQITREGIIILKRNEDNIHEVGDSRLIDFILSATMEAKRQNVLLQKIGNLEKKRVNLGIYAPKSSRLYLVTPGVCIATIKGKQYQLHQIETEYGGIKEGSSSRADVYDEIANLTSKINDSLYKVTAALGIPSSLTKFEWLAGLNGISTRSSP